MTDNKPQMQKVQRTASSIKTKNPICKHSIFKLQKTEEKEILERSQRKNTPCLEKNKDKNYNGLLWYIKKYIWSLFPVSGRQLLKPLKCPQCQEYLCYSNEVTYILYICTHICVYICILHTYVYVYIITYEYIHIFFNQPSLLLIKHYLFTSAVCDLEFMNIMNNKY